MERVGQDMQDLFQGTILTISKEMKTSVRMGGALAEICKSGVS